MTCLTELPRDLSFPKDPRGTYADLNLDLYKQCPFAQSLLPNPVLHAGCRAKSGFPTNISKCPGSQGNQDERRRNDSLNLP